MLTRAKRKRVEGQLWSYSTIDPRTKRRRKCIFSCSLLEPALNEGREETCINHSYTRAMYYRAKLNKCLETRKCWSREHVVSTARHNIPLDQKGRSLRIMQQLFEKTNEQGIILRGSNGVVKATKADFISRLDESNKVDVDRKLVTELEENGPFVIRFAMRDHFFQARHQESRDFVYVSSPSGFEDKDRKANSHCVVVTGHGVREGDGLPFWEYQNSYGSSFRNISALPEEKGLGLGRVAKDSVLVAVVPHDCCVSGEAESSLVEVSSHGGEETGN